MSGGFEEGVLGQGKTQSDVTEEDLYYRTVGATDNLISQSK